MARANSIGIFMDMDSIGISIVISVAGYPYIWASVLFYEINFVRAIESLRTAHAVKGNIFQKTKAYIEREREKRREATQERGIQ